MAVNPEEIKFIHDNLPERAHFSKIVGALAHVRESGLTLDEAFKQATHKLGQEEHWSAEDIARDFLRENAEIFGIKSE